MKHADENNFWRISPIMRRILAVNVAALLILGGGLLYSGQYERGLVRSELGSMTIEGRLLAAAFADGAVRENAAGDRLLAEDLARHLLRKLSEKNDHRILIFSRNGELLLDSRQLTGPGGLIEIVNLPPPFASWSMRQKAEYGLYRALDSLPLRLQLPSYPYDNKQTAQGYPGLIDTLGGEERTGVWRDHEGKMLLTAALPIQDLKNVMGAVLLMDEGTAIDLSVRDLQVTVLKLFLYALLITIILSIYLSETIARPILRLAAAAERVRQSLSLKDQIPDFSYRRDEIGSLSASFRDMTAALSERIDAISNFAADVAHEIKNPLASVKSAVETLSIVQDEDKRARLLAILHDDINRLNRLITDISNASRLDGEISKSEKKTIAIDDFLRHLVQVQSPNVANKIILDIVAESDLTVRGNDIQLGQVMQNIINNAASFVADNGKITIAAKSVGDRIIVTVDNDGAPIPENKLETIFARFYSERPKGERFGLHSGLGLSISRQIIKAHQGTIHASNIKDAQGRHQAVRFTINLPKGV